MRSLLRMAALAGCLLATPAFAQSDDDFMNSDAMEVQRCIWRCQNNNPNMGKRYQQCINAQCNGEPELKQSKPRRDTYKRAKQRKRVIRNNRGDVLIRRLD